MSNHNATVVSSSPIVADQVSASVYERVVKGRRSVRGFTDEVVPQELIEQIFSLAQWAPSNCNTQPWFSHVVSGDSMQRLREGIQAAALAGEFSMDFDYSGQYDGVYKERQYDAASQLYSAMGIERDDKAGRHGAFMRNYAFFDAPHMVYLCLPLPFGLREAADLGMYAQTLMLAMQAHGIASCAQAAVAFQADKVRDVLALPAAHKILFGIAFGYEDTEQTANRCRVARAPLQQAVQFHR